MFVRHFRAVATLIVVAGMAAWSWPIMAQSPTPALADCDLISGIEQKLACIRKNGDARTGKYLCLIDAMAGIQYFDDRNGVVDNTRKPFVGVIRPGMDRFFITVAIAGSSKLCETGQNADKSCNMNLNRYMLMSDNSQIPMMSFSSLNYVFKDLVGESSFRLERNGNFRMFHSENSMYVSIGRCEHISKGE